MKLKFVLPILVAFGLAGAGFFGLQAVLPVSASSNSTETQAVFNHRGGGAGYNNQYLADALGITLEELNAAYENAYQSALEQAVADGLITQAQADDLLERGQAFPFGGRWTGWLASNGIDFDALLADALGISAEELQQAYQTAFNASVDAAVADGRLSEEQADLMKGQYALRSSANFQSAMRTAFENAVNQAVQEGVITQSQADRILENENNFGFGLRGFGGREGFGGPRGRHGMFNEQLPDVEQAPDSKITPPSITPSRFF